MEAKITDTGIEINFENAFEASQLLHALYCFKHREGDELIDLSNFQFRSSQIFELSVAINEFIESAPIENWPIPKSIGSPTSPDRKVTKDSWRFTRVFTLLEKSYDASWKKTNFSRGNLKGARLWVQHHFAPCIIDDELADYVIEKLHLLKD